MITYENSGRIQVGVLIVTLALLVAHTLGLFTISHDLVNPTNRFVMSTKGAVGEISTHNEHITATCQFPESIGHRYCNLVILTSNSLSSGLDLSKYDHLTLNVGFDGLDKYRNLLFYFWNFNPLYSVESDDSTLKFNATTFIPKRQKSPVTIDLKRLSVPTWWLTRMELGHEHSGMELDNVAAMQISLDHEVPEGIYSLTLSSAMLTGQLVSQATILIVGGLLFLLANLWGIYLRQLSKNQLAHRDLLTGQLNRKGLLAWINERIQKKPKFTYILGSQEVAVADDNLVVVYIDLDDFKKINDTYGHRAGDQLLKAICERINTTIEHHGLLGVGAAQCAFARLSGDEFCLAVNGLKMASIDDFARGLLNLVTQPYDLDALQVKVHSSIGLSLYSFDIANAENLLHQADLAMYHSKKNGKNQYYIFDYKLQELIELRKTISVALKTAIEKKDFEIVFMPIYNCQTGVISGAEVLLRANSPALSDIGPEVFVPIAEEYGFIREIDLWVLERTFQRISDFPNLFRELKIRFAINISSIELHNPRFIERVKELLKRYQVDASLIELEITETNLTNVDEQSINFLKDLQALGIRLALDDFGTGYTGFNQLLHYPIDVVKIDRSFISRINQSKQSDTTMVDAILSITQSYDLQVVAEGVETSEQLNYMKEHGCDLVQGYYLSRPLSWEGFMIELKTLSGAQVSRVAKLDNVKPLRARQPQEQF